MRGSEIDVITGVRPQVLNTPIQTGEPGFVWYYWDAAGRARGPFHSKSAAVKSIQQDLNGPTTQEN